MLIQNLFFFDKFGKNLNLEYNTNDGYWYGKIFFKPISIYLFDNENLFILEKLGSTYKFPSLSIGQKIKFEWKDNFNENEFFLYEIKRENELNAFFINKLNELTISYEDTLSSSSQIDIKLPLQVNIAFNPSSEKIFERTLYMFIIDDLNPNNNKKIAEIHFYGEGEDEEERFRIWGNNFGIKFNKEDANILKDYDIKEALPDWNKVNRIRKDLLVNKDQIFPYLGTYKALINFINILGYKDVLSIKEYWKNINKTSKYFNKMILIDIYDYLDDGEIDSLNSIKDGLQFKKTEFLALVFQFTKETGEFDDDGLPIVEKTTEFTYNEIFYKLNRLDEKLKQDFVPINVKIKDIIGEFIHFQKISLYYWKDYITIKEYNLNELFKVEKYPKNDVNLTLRSLDPLFKQKDSNGIDYGIVRFNNDTKNPFENNQYYKRSEIIKIKQYIEKFYEEIKNQRFPNLNKRLSWEYGDDPERIIGAPIIFKIDIEKFTFKTFKGVTWEEMDSLVIGEDPYWTLENLDFRNVYEIVWKITKDSPNPYNFTYRGKITELYELPHFLPYAGKYSVIIELWDFYGNITVLKTEVEVQDDKKPQIIAFSRLEDKFNYRISNLSNIQLKDFGSSTFYYPKVNVLNNENIHKKIDIFKNLLEWISFYKNRYGLGQNLYDVEIYNEATKQYIKYNDPIQNHPKKNYWGLGEGKNQLTLKDLENIQLGSLYFMRFCDLIYLDDFKAGFYLENPIAGQKIKISLFSEYEIPYFTSLEDLVNQLNQSNHPGISLFNYEIISGKIHAQANFLSKETYHFLEIINNLSPSSPNLSPSSPNLSPSSPINFSPNSIQDKYTFFLPKKVYSNRVINFLNSISPFFDPDTLFLYSKTSDVLSGAVQNPYFWEQKEYWKFEQDIQKGHLPTLIDQNAFNLNNIKIFEDSFKVPKNAIVFFTINNLDGKLDFIWTLIDSYTNKEIFRAKSVPFFVWKFKDIGMFSMKVEVIDNRGTSYTNEIKNFITVLDKTNYISQVEFNLNQRKNKLLNKKSLF